MVKNPDHYGGVDNPYESIKVIENWDLGFHLGNTVKYISRAGKKYPEKEIEDLEKALFYLSRRIENLKNVKMKINKEYLEIRLGKEISDFKVGLTKNGITEVKYVLKSDIQETELILYVNNETIDENVS